MSGKCLGSVWEVDLANRIAELDEEVSRKCLVSVWEVDLANRIAELDKGGERVLVWRERRR